MQRIFNTELITLDHIDIPVFNEKAIQVFVLRLDKIHSVVSGNKYFKLKYHLQYAIENKYEGIITFGGAWSNHIVATACIASNNQLKSIGIIRGECPKVFSNTLLHAKEFGMQLEFISRELYGKTGNKHYLNNLFKQYPEYYIIPEGGSGAPGIKGAAEILSLVNKNEFSHIVTAIGTGTTFCGIANASSPAQHNIGIPVLKGISNLQEQYAGILRPTIENSNITFIYDYHFGGYAKYSATLVSFMNEFYRQTVIPTDFVYTGKLFFAVHDLVQKIFFPPGSRILVIHSGGLQGNSSLEKGTLIF